MSKRAWVFLLLFLLLLLIALQTGRQLFFSMAFMLGASLVLSLLWAWTNLRWVSLSRLTQSLRTQVGRPVEERLVVRNQGWLPKLWLEVRDYSELPDHRVSRVVHGVPPRLSRSWSVKTNARYRGRYHLGPMTLRSGDPLGLFSFERALPQVSAITVYPATYDLPAFLPPMGQLTGGETLQQRTHNITPNFAGVREYRPGDSYNRIHWRSTARTGRIIVKEFEEDPTSDIWIVLDMSRRTHIAAPEMSVQADHTDLMFAWLGEKAPEILPTTTEYGVTVAASLIKHFLEQNRSVGMIAHSKMREIMQPDRGLRPLTRALEYLAVLQSEGRHAVGEVLMLEESAFVRGSTVIVVTSSADAAWVQPLRELQRRGVRSMAILINPTSFDPRVPSQDELQASLAVQNIPTYVVNQNDAIPVALSLPLGKR
ncbi:MAG: DUF58 domain-containing protein [Ardenticatenales bacterium]|nr:DUF58 domain-containing protein [Ardenticatenales bacterium]